MQSPDTYPPFGNALQAAPAQPTQGTGTSIADAAQERSDPRRYFAVVMAHWWVVLLVLLLCTAVGAAYAITATPRYQAACRSEIMPDDRLRVSTNVISQPTSAESLARQRGRQITIITGDALRNQVDNRLNARWKGVIPELGVSISARPVREVESMLDISVNAVNVEYALDYLTTLLEQYKEAQSKWQMEANENALRSLWVEKKRLSDELETANNTLVQFQKEHNIQFNRARQQFDDAFLAGLVQRQNALKMERTMLEAQFPAIRQSSTLVIQNVLELTMGTHDATMDALPTAGINQDNSAANMLANLGKRDGRSPDTMVARTWQQQEELVARLKAEYMDMLTQYKADHPRMVDLQRYIGAAERELRFGAETALKRLQSRYEALKIQETALDESARAWKGNNDMSVADRATYDNLQSKVDHMKQQHDLVYAKIIDTASQNSDPFYNHTVDPPHAISNPVWPNKPVIMAISIIIGLLLGIAVAILLDFLDTSMMDVLAIEQKLGIQYLSSIPSWDRIIPNLDMKNAQVVVDRKKTSITSEVYRSLRTSLETVINNQKGYALGITSTEANEGKSLTTINLAVVFSWTGKKVLLVDGDLRRGKLNDSFGLEMKTGLTEYLLGSVRDWHEVVHHTVHENLDLIMVGAYHPSAPELLDPTRMKKLVEEWGKEYDLIIFDTAPIGRVVDSALLGRACNGMLLVTRHGHCTFAGVRHAIHRLEGAKVVGFCLNGIEVTSKRLGYFNYYGYFRRFGRYGHYAYYSQDKYRYGQYGYSPGAATKEEDGRRQEDESGAPPAVPPPA